MKKIYVCGNSITGILSAIYDAWKESRDADAGIEIRGFMEPRMFCEYAEVTENELKARAVSRLIQKNMGYNTWWSVYHALLSRDTDRADAVFHVMCAARKIPSGRRIMEHLTNPDVAKVFELDRRVSNEAHLFKEFIRFRELENQVLFSEISPDNHILVCIGDHFADRFPMENWMIYDKTHEECILHRAHYKWVLVSGQELNQDVLRRISDAESEYEQLWKTFFDTISIKERENPKCQQTHLPLRYRADMTEFGPTIV